MKHLCWWTREDLIFALGGRVTPKANDRVPCRECKQVWICTPGFRAGGGSPAGWVRAD